MKRKKIYIAGPMRGIPEMNFPAFDDARDDLGSTTWEVISPADLDRSSGMDCIKEEDLTPAVVQEIMHRDCSAIIDDADALALLPGWDTSVGAAAELALARWKGIPIFEYPSMLPLMDHGPQDSWAIFLGGDGLDYQLKEAMKLLEVGKAYIVTGGEIHQSSSSLRLLGFEGKEFNSVMFKLNWDNAPIENPYATLS